MSRAFLINTQLQLGVVVRFFLLNRFNGFHTAPKDLLHPTLGETVKTVSTFNRLALHPTKVGC
jgi:hypothetical protein